MPITIANDNPIICSKSDETYCVFRVEGKDRCWLEATQWRVLEGWNKKHQDHEAARRSKFFGSTVARKLGGGRIAHVPYEVERPFLATRVGGLLNARMHDACSGYEKDEIPVSPSFMARQLLGCSLSMLVEQFERQMQCGMTWDNFGSRGWVIDHIVPLATFDLRRIEQASKACHYTNLRPCWEQENSRKKDGLVLIAERICSR